MVKAKDSIISDTVVTPASKGRMGLFDTTFKLGSQKEVTGCQSILDGTRGPS